MNGTAVQRFWECSRVGYRKASHQHAQRCVKVIFRTAWFYAFSHPNPNAILCMNYYDNVKMVLETNCAKIIKKYKRKWCISVGVKGNVQKNHISYTSISLNHTKQNLKYDSLQILNALTLLMSSVKPTLWHTNIFLCSCKFTKWKIHKTVSTWLLTSLAICKSHWKGSRGGNWGTYCMKSKVRLQDETSFAI